MSAVLSSAQTVREFEGRYIDDGYEFIGVAEATGWRVVAAWGLNGWDLGEWPYVVFVFRESNKGVQRAVYIEGDVTIETYASLVDREQATDESAMFYWRHRGSTLHDAPSPLPAEGEEVPACFRGEFSWARLDAVKASS